MLKDLDDIGRKAIEVYAPGLLGQVKGFQQEIKRLRKSLGDLVDSMGMSSPMPLLDAGNVLCEAAEHLLTDHTCDGEGHERRRLAQAAWAYHGPRVNTALRAILLPPEPPSDASREVSIALALIEEHVSDEDYEAAGGRERALYLRLLWLASEGQDITKAAREALAIGAMNHPRW